MTRDRDNSINESQHEIISQVTFPLEAPSLSNNSADKIAKRFAREILINKINLLIAMRFLIML
jgi:hypothetical protein